MKVVSINIEKKSHLEQVVDFVNKEKADVVCIQEVMDDTFSYLMHTLEMSGTFAPFVTLEGWGEGLDGNMGVAVLSREPHVVEGVHYYQGVEGKINTLKNKEDIHEIHDAIARAVLVVSTGVCTIGTTHFTYTKDGEPDDVQRRSLGTMLKLLKPYGDLVFCGDFNIPRPNELYRQLKNEFTDTIPESYHSSLDSKLHRVPGLQKMVDYMWVRGRYVARNVHLVEGVSDHCAIIAEVEKLDN